MYIKKIIQKNPGIVSGRKHFFDHHQRIIKTINVIKVYFKIKD